MNIDKVGKIIVHNFGKCAQELMSTSPMHLRPKHIDPDSLRYIPSRQDLVSVNPCLKFETRLRAESSIEPVRISIGEDTSDWLKFTDSQMGSQDAFWAKSEQSGELFYIKYAQDLTKEDHVESEILASKLYNLAGIDTPDVTPILINGKIKGLASRYIPNLKDVVSAKSLHEGFAPDVWLGNWDALEYGNTFINKGRLCKLDNGGALRYRAMGELKPEFGDKPDEIFTFLNGKNFTTQITYESMTQSDLIKSFEKVCNISDEAVLSLVFDKNLAHVLINRKNYMGQVLEEIKSTQKGNEDLLTYLQKITSRVDSKFKFSSETIMEELSKSINNKMYADKSLLYMPSTKSIVQNLISELETLERNNVKISKQDILDLLDEIVSEGLDIKVPENKKLLNQVCSMETLYTDMFSGICELAESTRLKPKESATSFLKRIINIYNETLNENGSEVIKSNLKYFPDEVIPKPKLTSAQKIKAVKELMESRRSDINSGSPTIIPILTPASSDKQIHNAWRNAHLGGFKFFDDKLQCAVMELGDRYSALCPVKTRSAFSTPVYEKDYDNPFEVEPVYRWMSILKPEEFVKIPKLGDIYTVPTYQCCSTHKLCAEVDYGDHIPNLNVKFIIHPKSETSRAYNTGFNQEVVYRPGERFRILGKRCIENINEETSMSTLRWEIHMQEA